MQKNIYIIREYDLIGAKLYSYDAMGLDEIKTIDKYKDKIKKITGTIDGEYFEISSNRYFDLSETPKGYDSYINKYLPYKATVIEDLPPSVKGLTPKKYNDCVLMAEKHGGYLQFYHKKTDSILRIAMNSHYYTPTN